MAYLKGFTNLGDSTITNHVRENLLSFLDYGLIEKSNFENVEIPSSGYYDGLDHKLRPVSDPRYTDGQVWESARANWVWESGVGALTSTDNAYPGVSGVYVGGTFYPVSTTGTYAHHINHPMGRVVFDSAISTSSDVQCEYSYKYINVVKVDGLQWFSQIQKNSERSDDANFIGNSGEWAVLSENRQQLPMIGVEVSPIRRMEPYQLGGGQTVFTDFLFHCVADNMYDRDFLVDLICLQNQKVFDSFDLNDVATNNAFPLDYRGVPVSGALRYPDLVSTYTGIHIRLVNSRIDSMYSLTPDIHVGTVKVTTECILFGV